MAEELTPEQKKAILVAEEAKNIPDELTFCDEHGFELTDFGVLKLDEREKKALALMMVTKNMTLEEVITDALEWAADKWGKDGTLEKGQDVLDGRTNRQDSGAGVEPDGVQSDEEE